MAKYNIKEDLPDMTPIEVLHMHHSSAAVYRFASYASANGLSVARMLLLVMTKDRHVAAKPWLDDFMEWSSAMYEIYRKTCPPSPGNTGYSMSFHEWCAERYPER